jgi:Cys-rich repeat protein
VGGSAQGGSSGGNACTVNHDCAAGEDCVGKTCQLRCKVSCQCPDGQVCDAGYCGLPSAPVVSCQSDCDCVGGQSCVGNACQ